MFRRWLFLLVLSVASGQMPVTAGQEKQSSQPTDEKAELAEFVDDARHYAIRSMKPQAALKLHEPPMLNFTNPERGQECGSVFVWLHEDRPAVMGQFFRLNGGNNR